MWIAPSQSDPHSTEIYIQGVPKKTHDLVFLAITPLWKGLEIKVGWFFKNSGNM